MTLYECILPKVWDFRACTAGWERKEKGREVFTQDTILGYCTGGSAVLVSDKGAGGCMFVCIGKSCDTPASAAPSVWLREFLDRTASILCCILAVRLSDPFKPSGSSGGSCSETHQLHGCITYIHGEVQAVCAKGTPQHKMIVLRLIAVYKQYSVSSL